MSALPPEWGGKLLREWTESSTGFSDLNALDQNLLDGFAPFAVCAGFDWGFSYFSQHFGSRPEFAETCEFSIELRCITEADEKLAAGGIGVGGSGH